MRLLTGLDLATKSVERTAEDIGADIAAREQCQVDAAGVPVVETETANRLSRE